MEQTMNLKPLDWKMVGTNPDTLSAQTSVGWYMIHRRLPIRTNVATFHLKHQWWDVRKSGEATEYDTLETAQAAALRDLRFRMDGLLDETIQPPEKTGIRYGQIMRRTNDVVFIWDLGATVGLTTHLAALGDDQSFKVGNLVTFRIDGDHVVVCGQIREEALPEGLHPLSPVRV
jgi:hypothetical protein